ncbi:hypothetical protein INT45_013184 [Circinella minor]|uniref:Myb/SANT-like domain-containing protein n=1 Tax=Circinella minor TaxID=1195481 RepID=A0A8H7RAG7_9FUNG|nr:hypothetical protein INT45_013184 [Circinella minor]
MQQVWNLSRSTTTPSPRTTPTFSTFTDGNLENVTPRPEENYLPLQPSVANDFEASMANGNISWNPDTIEELLSLMDVNYNSISETSNQRVVANLWEGMCTDLKARAAAALENDTSYDVATFTCLLNVEKMKCKWNTMRSNYVMIRDACGLTGVGGEHPNVNWIYYDKVGQILKEDRSIHPENNIESMGDGDRSGESVFENFQAEQDQQSTMRLFQAAEETQAMATAPESAAAAATAATTTTEAAATTTTTEAATTTGGVGRGRYSFIDIAAVRRNLTEANIEFDQWMERSQDSMFDRLNGILERQAAKRKADLDDAVDAIVRERSADRELKRQRHENQQLMLARMNDNMEKMVRGQRAMLRMMGYADEVTERGHTNDNSQDE